MRPVTLRSSVAVAALCIGSAAASPQSINPANGHAYEFVSASVSWTGARAAAEAASYLGVQGHLATISDAVENDFVSALAPNGGWIGGFQDLTSPSYSEPGGGWTWVTGEPFSFTNWGATEPNNTPANEDVLELWSSGQWNDAPDQVSGFLVGYVVEYDLSPCAPDAFGQNHSCASASFLGSSSILLLNADLVVSDAEPDYFQIPFQSGFDVFVRADFDHDEGDINLELFRADSCDGTPTESSFGVSDSEEIRRFSGFDYVLKVSRNGGSSACSAYRLSVTLQGASTSLGSVICLANINSTGDFAGLNALGSSSVGSNSLSLSASVMPTNTFGYFLNSPGFGFLNVPSSQGFLCIDNGGIGRFSRPGEIMSTGATGGFALDVDVNDVPRSMGITQVLPGESWAFQCWYRDTTPGGQATSNFSNGVMVWFDE
jgi:hypothetical protein